MILDSFQRTSIDQMIKLLSKKWNVQNASWCIWEHSQFGNQRIPKLKLSNVREIQQKRQSLTEHLRPESSTVSNVSHWLSHSISTYCSLPSGILTTVPSALEVGSFQNFSHLPLKFSHMLSSNAISSFETLTLTAGVFLLEMACFIHFDLSDFSMSMYSCAVIVCFVVYCLYLYYNTQQLSCILLFKLFLQAGCTRPHCGSLFQTTLLQQTRRSLLSYAQDHVSCTTLLQSQCSSEL